MRCKQKHIGTSWRHKLSNQLLNKIYKSLLLVERVWVFWCSQNHWEYPPNIWAKLGAHFFTRPWLLNWYCPYLTKPLHWFLWLFSGPAWKDEDPLTQHLHCSSFFCPQCSLLLPHLSVIAVESLPSWTWLKNALSSFHEPIAWVVGTYSSSWLAWTHTTTIAATLPLAFLSTVAFTLLGIGWRQVISEGCVQVQKERRSFDRSWSCYASPSPDRRVILQSQTTSK